MIISVICLKEMLNRLKVLVFQMKAYAMPNNPIYVKTSELLSAVESAINTFYDTSDNLNDIMGHFSDYVSKKSVLTLSPIYKNEKVLDNNLLLILFSEYFFILFSIIVF